MAIVSPRASARDRRVAPPAFYGDLDALLERGDLKRALQEIIEWQRLTVGVVNGLMAGKHNAGGSFTLTANVAASTLTDRRICAATKIFLFPQTANAATEIATLFQTYPNVTAKQAVFNHASNAQTDRTFSFLLAG